ncbi:MAG: PAS domain S-box protein, partial [Candidatus Nitrosotenuis sp.]
HKITGEYLWFADSPSPQFDADGKFIGYLGIATEITEQKRLKDELRHSLKMSERLVESNPDALLIVDLEGRITQVNPQAQKMFGYTSGELIGNHIEMLIPERFRTTHIQHRIRYAQNPTTRPMGIGLELYARRKDGTEFPVDVALGQMKLNGTIVVLCSVRNMTEQKRAKQEMELLSVAVNQTADCVVITDRNGVIQYVNEAFERESGYSKEEALGKTPRILKSDQHKSEFFEVLWKTILDGQVFKAVFINRKKSGELFYESKTITPIKDAQGNITHFVSTAKNITQQIEAEEALRKVTERYRELFETTSELIQTVTLEGNILYVNRAWREVLGYQQEELANITLHQIVDPNYLPRCLDTLGRVARGEKVHSIETVFVAKDGRRIDVEGTLSCRYEHAQPTVISCFLRDVTAQKRSEAERLRLFTALEESLNEIYIFDARTLRFQWVNKGARRNIGYDLSALQSLTPLDLKPEFTETSFRAMIQPLVDRTKQQHIFETIHRRADGTTYPVEVHLQYLEEPSGGVFIAIIHDITQRLLAEEQLRRAEAEKNQLQLELLQSQKIESLGTLAGGIAHDFNNILGIILGHATMIDRLPLDRQKFSQSLDAIVKATLRGASLVKQLLTFARKTEPAFESVNVNEVIKEITKLIAETFPKVITLETNLADDLPTIVADSTQLHQVVLNLCVNARDAMPMGGKLSISTSTVPGTVINQRFPNAVAQQYIQLRVADTGIGMDESTRQRIFEPFFTTKGLGKGTGLGLSVIHGIVQSHHGIIDVESAVGQGTTFTIYFPIAERTVEQAQSMQKDVGPIPGGHETVLVIEDEQSLAELVKAILVSKGYTVLTARDGKEGIEQYIRHMKEIDLVLCDMGLPTIGGDDVFRHLKTLNPSVKFIFATGFIDPDVKSELLKAGVKHFLQKPYLPVEVLQAIRKIIDLENS